MTVASIEGAAGSDGSSPIVSFGDRLADWVASRESQVVLGLDPDPARLWPAAIARADDPPGQPSDDSPGQPPHDSPGESPHDSQGEPPHDSQGEPPGHTPGGPPGEPRATDATPAARAARAVAAHCALVIGATAEHCVAVKLQVACFERLGAPGWSALAATVAVARERGLLVIADAKRGDVDVTATAYAQAFLGETPSPFGPIPGLGVDALTVNPLLGRDSLEPFVSAARAHGRGLFVLVRTSNPGAADVQEQSLTNGGALSDHLAELTNEIGRPGVKASGLSDIGAVVGATAPGRMGGLRERMPNAPFLLPGVGAQGGRVEGLAPAFAPGRAGGLVSASRGIVGAYEHAGGDPAAAAAREASRLRELAWHLSA